MSTFFLTCMHFSCLFLLYFFINYYNYVDCPPSSLLLLVHPLAIVWWCGTHPCLFSLLIYVVDEHTICNPT